MISAIHNITPIIIQYHNVKDLTVESNACTRDAIKHNLDENWEQCFTRQTAPE